MTDGLYSQFKKIVKKLTSLLTIVNFLKASQFQSEHQPLYHTLMR